MNKWKNWLLGSGLVSILLFLSGCVRMDSNGNPDTSGIVYRVLVHPMGQAITYLVENFNWSYGWAVIAMTVIVRIIILPLGISQSKKTMIQSEKMQALKPQVEAAQQKLKAATTREEQMAAQAEMQQVYRENGLSMTGGIGCLPLLIQMPIFSALYFTARYTEGIRESSFYGIDLGSPSMVLVAIAGVAYLLQGYISTIGIPEEQKKNDAYDADRLSCYDRLHVDQCASRCYTLLGSRWCVQLSANIHHKRYDETTFESTSGRRVETKPAKTSRHSKKRRDRISKAS